MKYYLISALFIMASNLVTAQGCSDAGFCTIGGLTYGQAPADMRTKNTVRLSMPIGLGDENVVVLTPSLEYTLEHKNWQWQGKLSANYASGNLGSAFGPGDVVFSGTYTPPVQHRWKPSFTLGTKLPLNGGDLTAGGRSLPMQYQSSLGTIDLIAGVAFSTERWTWAAGWQQPLTGENQNKFLPRYWNDAKAVAYPPGNSFNRKGDLLLRTNYAFIQKEKGKLTAGLLGIYHLGEDTYRDALESVSPIPIKGSEGLTLNLTAAGDMMLSKRLSLGLVFGVPLVVRDVRPDGLTRRFVLAPQVLFHF
jgi:hypothetical protein